MAARLELSTGRIFRSRDAGLDVMGDGRLVPYAGGIRKRPLDADGDSAVRGDQEALQVNDEIEDRSRDREQEGRRGRPPGEAAARRRAADPRLRQRGRADRGADYDIRNGEVVFSRSIVKEGKVGGMRWVAMYSGCSAPTASTRRSTSSTDSGAR